MSRLINVIKGFFALNDAEPQNGVCEHCETKALPCPYKFRREKCRQYPKM